jgi:small subunit ribosomal protein S16
MATVLRLQRFGTHKRPFYRMVVTDSRARRDGRYIELLGTYDPMTEPNIIDVNLERIDHWVGLGAKPSESVASLIKRVREGRAITHADFTAARQKALADRRHAAFTGAKIVEAPIAPTPAPAPAAEEAPAAEPAPETAAEAVAEPAAETTAE